MMTASNDFCSPVPGNGFGNELFYHLPKVQSEASVTIENRVASFCFIFIFFGGGGKY